MLVLLEEMCPKFKRRHTFFRGHFLRFFHGKLRFFTGGESQIYTGGNLLFFTGKNTVVELNHLLQNFFKIKPTVCLFDAKTTLKDYTMVVNIFYKLFSGIIFLRTK